MGWSRRPSGSPTPTGPRQNPLKRQGVIPIFLRRVAEGQPLTVFGDGSMIRDYLYVADLAEMIAEVVTVGRQSRPVQPRQRHRYVDHRGGGDDPARWWAGTCRWSTCHGRPPSSTTSCSASSGSRPSSPPGRRPHSADGVRLTWEDMIRVAEMTGDGAPRHGRGAHVQRRALSARPPARGVRPADRRRVRDPRDRLGLDRRDPGHRRGLPPGPAPAHPERGVRPRPDPQPGGARGRAAGTSPT